MKVNKIKKSILIIILTIGLALVSGCVSKKETPQIAQTSTSNINTELFDIEGRQDLNNVDMVLIIKHKETGKRFIIYRGYEKGGITALD